MMASDVDRTQRLRDPVHGLIVFREGDKVDQLAWRLIATPEFQRLRRIRQLGVSEYVFPGATHTRFAHSIGVFHTARTLVGIIRRELNAKGQQSDDKREEVALIAALLHDLGHGPFSHAFEAVLRGRGGKKHEKWSAEIIRASRGIRPVLDQYRDGLADDVAAMIEADDPMDIYHAVVSSSFDADRLDYLRRDKLMTGTGAGAIDFDWLLEHLRVAEIEIEAAEADNGDRMRVPSFCFDPKAQPAAEQFLLARYTLYEQVYLHKTTRCVEAMVSSLLRRVAEQAKNKRSAAATGLTEDHPLLRFLRPDGANLGNFLALDDIVMGGAIAAMTNATDAVVADFASRIRERRLFKTLDVVAFGADEGKQQRAARRIDADFEEEIDAGTVIKDEAGAFSIYTQIGGDDDKAHKKLHILDPAEGPVEISRLSAIVRELGKRKFTRYYFSNESDRDRARSKRRKTA